MPEAPAAWSFQHPTVVHVGAGSWLAGAKRALGRERRVLLVTGSRTLEHLHLDAALAALCAEHQVTLTHARVPSEPDTVLVDAVAAQARAAGCVAVLAIGGGSAMDTAKAAAALATNPGRARDYLEGLPTGGGQALGTAPLPVICIPTTAGTGSEVTKNAVLQVPEHRFKRSLRSDLLYPREAWIDPTLSALCPQPIAAACGWDAFTHLVEAFTSSAPHPIADALATAAIPRAIAGLRAIAEGRRSLDSASDLAWASTAGGICLANAGLGAAHGLVAPLGGSFPVAHGAALAALLPATIAVSLEALAEPARATAPATRTALDRYRAVAGWLIGSGASVDALPAALTDLRRRLRLPGLHAYGVTATDAEAIAAAPSGSLKTNPVGLSAQRLAEIVVRAIAD